MPKWVIIDTQFSSICMCSAIVLEDITAMNAINNMIQKIKDWVLSLAGKGADLPRRDSSYGRAARPGSREAIARRGQIASRARIERGEPHMPSGRSARPAVDTEFARDDNPLIPAHDEPSDTERLEIELSKHYPGDRHARIDETPADPQPEITAEPDAPEQPEEESAPAPAEPQQEEPAPPSGLQGYSIDSVQTRKPFYSRPRPVEPAHPEPVHKEHAAKPPRNPDETFDMAPRQPEEGLSAPSFWQPPMPDEHPSDAEQPEEEPRQAYGIERFKSLWARKLRADGADAAGEGQDNGEEPVAKKRLKLFKSRQKPPNAVLGVAFTTLQLTLFAVLLIGVVGAGAVIGIAKAYVDTTPTLDVGKIQNQDLTSFIYDSNGELITTFAGMENRVWATVDEIPKNLLNAIVAVEDARFYTHNGVDLKRIVGSFLSNMSSDTSQGGSTLTQQLIKNTMVTNERTYKRKIQEAWLAMQLEAEYRSKYPDDYKGLILEAYLNTIPLGQSNYGVKAAAKDYFGKELNQLTLRECAMLAGLAQSPYLYDPRRNTYTRSRMDITDKRTNTVLGRMYEQGYIDKGQYEQALAEKVAILKDAATTQMYDMPYFVEYAIEDVKTHLLESRGLENTSENRGKLDSELRSGGYKIYLTVDPKIQKTVENTLFTWKKYPKMQISRDSSTTVRDGGSGYTTIQQPQAGAVVLDYHTGELKAIVGGRQQPNAKRTLNRAWQSYMPVGSCIKPLAVYAPAIEKGFSPASIVYNVPAPVEGWNTAQGYPSNYGGGSFKGPMSLRAGLTNSYNVVAAHVLMDDVGIEDSYNTLLKMGIKPTTSLKKDGPGLALGTSGITLVEMTAAYGTFGNKGEYIEPLSFTKVVDSKGIVVLDAEKIRKRQQVFKESTAWLMVNMMTDVINKGTGTKAKIPNMTVAGKTGTNSNYVGVSFNALTPYYSAAVWVGSDVYKPLYKGASGGSDAAPLWQAFMAQIHKGLKNKAIIEDKPEDLGLVKATVCGVSGKLVTEACKHDEKYKPVTDWFLRGTEPTETCNMHYQMKVCTVSGKLATEYCPADTVEESSILIVPQDSIIRTMKPEDIAKYFPNAMLDFPGVDDLAALTPDNPEFAQYFCNIHTEDWAGILQQYNDLAALSNTLVKNVRNRMDGVILSQSVRDALNTKIKTVNDIIAKGFSDVNVAPQKVYNNLVAAYDDLKSYAELVLPETVPTPTPTPEPSPSPSPPPV